MTDRAQPVHIAALDDAWNGSWSGCPPAAHLLRRRFPAQWVRFHTLPESKRYATSETEHLEILRRHHLLLAELAANAMPAQQVSVAITCSWSATPQPAPRDTAVAATTPEAEYWRSDDLATDPGFHSWQHHYTSPVRLTDPALDQLLLCVADDMTDGVILTNTACTWVYHPYDGGADVFTSNTKTRDHLTDANSQWLPPLRPQT